ncbi:MAG: hypothetical protein SPLM_10470 [Spiroplasma phoeniceum]|uniref:hypothetical protein n=1 Tax=Spiroplasma phoeniceum TaxID=47835 RepID=UPI003133D49E
MKKLLSILTISTLTASVPAPLLANTVQTRDKRDVGATAKDVTTGFDLKIKEKSSWQQVKTQEKPFNTVDNKYYYVVWKGKNEDNWILIKFQNNKEIERFKPLVIDKQNENTLNINKFSEIPIENDLTINANTIIRWKNDNGKYFKSVYRWDGVGEPNLPIIDPKTGQITNWKG